MSSKSVSTEVSNLGPQTFNSNLNIFLKNKLFHSASMLLPEQDHSSFLENVSILVPLPS